MHKSLGIESSIVITALHFANLAPKLKYSISLSLKPSKPSVIFSLELNAKSLAPVSTFIPGKEPEFAMTSTRGCPFLLSCLSVSSNNITPEI